jgi:site-specific recombinase XerD
MCKEIGERAGVPNCHPHRFRRSLATRLIKKGVPLEQVQRILGHSKIETTLIYAEVSQADIKMNHDKYAS